MAYELDKGYSQDFYNEFIKKAIDKIYKDTGIKWVKRTKEEGYALIKDKCGCVSVVGNSGKKQDLCLGIVFVFLSI